jgi:glycosyltransferase involved in cell wall biosynthesis
MGDLYRLSIVTVVRNAPDALAATIESVREQTYPAVEFVVVDGASTDRTADVLQRNAARIDKWVSEPDRGIYDAMNKGKALASGDFVMFVNAGDVFVGRDVIARMMAFVDDKDGLYFGKVRLLDCTGRLSWEVPIVPRRRAVPPSSYLPHHQSVFYPRCYYASNHYDPSMGYRADVHFTKAACERLRRHFTNVTLVQATLGGASSRAIMTIADLRKELANETAYARHVGATTGRRAQLVDVTGSLIVRYMAAKAGGLPLVHRLMYLKHQLKSRLGAQR